MAAQPDWLPSILAEENFQKHHAFIDNFKHNHKAHSTIAYARLGASEERVKRHCKVQNERYVPFIEVLHTSPTKYCYFSHENLFESLRN